MSSTPACSVIIPTYNRRDLLRLSLNALCDQDIGTDAFEVLVADDGSDDGTAEMVAEFRGRLAVRHLFQPDEGHRVAAARNLGIANATSDVSVLVDSGVLLHSGALRAHLRSHEQDQPAAVIGYVYCFNLDNEDATEMMDTLDFADVDATIARLRSEQRWLDLREEFYAREPGPLRNLPAPWGLYWTCNVSARTSQLRAVGGLDESITSWGSEDIDLGYRLHRDGAIFSLNRDAAAIHHPHPKEWSAESRQGLLRNRRYLAEKYDTPITRLLGVEPMISLFDINDIIRNENLPSCQDYLAAARR
ncbi:glycosyl transferase [Actinoplanes cyaneus]|uniref:Glycosyl transferase n=1 Tax=Actinoplanes cyaneus TaxID=52696 RepID=A0A919IRB4_9ACTN|nr:glycosyltransferase [Actinoplanes cyaneus]MCW2144030.1 N-terminal domain of galactosyltransferase [Actinoplanes cyaneus]GID70754.1 glycosyl transferase [Actinoplanes cyaneus]